MQAFGRYLKVAQILLYIIVGALAVLFMMTAGGAFGATHNDDLLIVAILDVGIIGGYYAVFILLPQVVCYIATGAWVTRETGPDGTP